MEDLHHTIIHHHNYNDFSLALIDFTNNGIELLQVIFDGDGGLCNHHFPAHIQKGKRCSARQVKGFWNTAPTDIPHQPTIRSFQQSRTIWQLQSSPLQHSEACTHFLQEEEEW